MITHNAFAVEPWCLRETSLDLAVLAQSESIFALSNGHIGWRGNLDEGEPNELPGSYLNGFYERRPLPYAEAGYGYPESGETLINVTNGKLIRLLVDDEPFDVRYGKLDKHERELDFRSGLLTRRVVWTAPTGRTVRIKSTRLVSFTHRAIAAVRYEIEPQGDPVRVVLQSEMVTNEPIEGESADPRVAQALRDPLCAEWYGAAGNRIGSVHRTRVSGLRVACAMDHELAVPVPMDVWSESTDQLGRLTVSALLGPGQRLRLTKFVAYGWSERRSSAGLRAQVAAALAAAKHTGWAGLLAEQREFLDGFWARADVELDGDAEVQQAVRFGLFHVAQAGARAERRAIPAKGLTGSGYDGHCFWDSEIFALPVLTYTLPNAAAHALLWRHDILPSALIRASELGHQGAAFPWRTISGRECSAYWPAGTAAFHINADIADAVLRYVDASGDEEFHRGPGCELLVQTARLWYSLGHFDADQQFHLDGMTGPDEYSAIADNNVYTNLMAQRNLTAGAAAASRFTDRAEQLNVSSDEIRNWRRAAKGMVVPFDERLGVHPQAERFTEYEVWDFATTDPTDYPLMLRYPYFDLYRKQVVKQADLVLALYLCGEEFSGEQKARDFEYYEPLTVRDSSLSACVQAVVAAEVGHLRLAGDYLREAALMDLADLEHNTRDGVHIASLAGAWLALVAGFGGMRHRYGQPLRFAPCLPPNISRLAFRVFFQNRLLAVEVAENRARYTLLAGEPIQLRHYDELFTLSDADEASYPVPVRASRPQPRQPPGRQPGFRGSPG